MAYLTYLLYQILWQGLVIGGCAYAVFWRDASGWWFLLAVLMSVAAYSPRRWIGLTEKP
jgi:hypothetical protein